MIRLRGLHVFATSLVASSLLASTSSPATSRSAGQRCDGHAPLPATALRPGIERLGCDLTGRVVYAGRVRVVVPPPGLSVAGDGIGRHGDVVGLRVTNTGDRVVAVRGVAGKGRRYLVAAAPVAPITTLTPMPAPMLTPMLAPMLTAPGTMPTGPALVGTILRSPSSGPASRVGRDGSLPACRDKTFNLEHHHWVTALRWRDNLGRAPKRLRKGVLVKQTKRANQNMRTGRNTCGRPRIDTPAAHYLGRTSVRPNIRTTSTTVGCGAFNTKNVVGFGDLPGNLLGWTCFWWVGGGRTAAADIMMDDGSLLVTHLPSDCSNQWDFEGAITHEFGHVYGLAHTGSGHDNLTMQHELRPCSTYARTLGLGDWLGMRHMYGVR